MLSLLAITAGQVVPVARIIEEVWDQHHDGAAHALQQHVSRLRRRLEPVRSAGAQPSVLVTRPAGYSLERTTTDISSFEREAAVGSAAARAGRSAEAMEALDAALARWRGPALVDVRYGAWFDGVATRLERDRLGVIETRAELRLDAGDHAALSGELDDLTRQAPHHERFWALLMIALYRSGRQADALAGFRRACSHAIELGLEVGGELRELEQAVLTHDERLDGSAGRRRTSVDELYDTLGPADVSQTGCLRLADGQIVAIGDMSLLIGRSAEAQVRLVDSRVSRRHAVVEADADGYVVRDLGSSNGTMVNGAPVSERRLVHGDVIEIGAATLTFNAP